MPGTIDIRMFGYGESHRRRDCSHCSNVGGSLACAWARRRWAERLASKFQTPAPASYVAPCRAAAPLVMTRSARAVIAASVSAARPPRKVAGIIYRTPRHNVVSIARTLSSDAPIDLGSRRSIRSAQVSDCVALPRQRARATGPINRLRRPGHHGGSYTRTHMKAR